MAALADPSYLTWQRVPDSLGLVLISPITSPVGPLVILQSHGITDSVDGSPTERDYQDTLVVSIFFGGGPLMTLE